MQKQCIITFFQIVVSHEMHDVVAQTKIHATQPKDLSAWRRDYDMSCPEVRRIIVILIVSASHPSAAERSHASSLDH